MVANTLHNIAGVPAAEKFHGKPEQFAQNALKSERFMRVLRRSNIRLRIKSITVWENNNMSCAANTIVYSSGFAH